MGEPLLFFENEDHQEWDYPRWWIAERTGWSDPKLAGTGSEDMARQIAALPDLIDALQDFAVTYAMVQNGCDEAFYDLTAEKVGRALTKALGRARTADSIGTPDADDQQ